jgi:tetratricopeptide (TPR) repeat protein
MKRFLRDPSKMLVALLGILIVVGAPSVRNRTAAEKAAMNQTTIGDLEARNRNAFALILGEIRATAADLMFIKTERYLHSGIAYKPHININKMATTGVVSAHPNSPRRQPNESEAPPQGHDHSHEPGENCPDCSPNHDDDHGQGCCPGGVPTLIRTAANDFRGFIGSLERETKPFQDPRLVHKHGRSEELLPWYRVMTLTDPNNVRGYMIGAMLLTFAKQHEQALSLVQEGIEKNEDNPQAFRLYASLAQVHWKSHHLEEASTSDCLEKALAAARRGYDMGKVVRPKHGKIGAVRKGVTWTNDIENDFLFLARMFPLLLEKKGEISQALKVAEEVASLAPDDIATQRMIERFRDEWSKQKPTRS